jgi:hypothetical protein
MKDQIPCILGDLKAFKRQPSISGDSLPSQNLYFNLDALIP